jgi:ribosome recycling factor
MSLDQVTKDLVQKTEKTIQDLKQKLAKVRTGRASAGLLDEIRVNYYGQLTPIKQMANITIPEPRLIIIQPYDPSVLREVEKSITNSGLGLNPQNDGKVIRVPIPELTEERRKEMVKLVKKIGEEHKVAIRQERGKSIETLRKMQKDKQITEDELHRGQEDLQKKVDKTTKDIDELCAKKEKEILEV